MKAIVNLELKADTAEGAQKIMDGLCAELAGNDAIGGYRYEIETADGPVTERCVLADGKVIA